MRLSPRVAALAAALLMLLCLAPAQAAGRPTEETWHGKQIHLYDAQAAGNYGAGVVVAVIDGWIDASHPDFQGRVKAGVNCTSGTCVAGQQRDDCTHGTHVAGTVGSSSFGVAPKVTILPVQVLLDDGKGGCTGRPSDVAAGIRWAVSKSARIINLSLGAQVPGVSQSRAIPDAVAEAAAAGVVVVFSAGNADLPLADSYSGNALVVAATGPSGALASYSQYGEGVDVAAPGGQPKSDGTCGEGAEAQAICVTSLYPGNQYAVAAGTSMAAPHVSGIAALLLGQANRSRSWVLSRIKGTAHPLSGAGSGLVDARAALGSAAQPKPTKSATPPPIIVRPVPRATTPPVKQPTAKPTVAPTKAVAAPRATVAPVPSVVPSPVPTELPSTSPSPAPFAFSNQGGKDDVPTPLALGAAALVALGAVSVMSVGLRRRS
ncbi:MAG: peptidase in kexin sedolisin [Frankiales bacterium]|nr:peptidase in kexin sedolisin [Frankiales bacterium]